MALDLVTVILLLVAVDIGYLLRHFQPVLRFPSTKRRLSQIVGLLEGVGRVCPQCRRERSVLALDDGTFLCHECHRVPKELVYGR